jgi:hypothetical protein
MNMRPRKKAMTFGDFISIADEVCGQRRAKAIVRNAVNEHLLQFRGKQTFLIS